MAFVASFTPGGAALVNLRALSVLAQQAELHMHPNSYQIIGRIRLDRRGELSEQLATRFPAIDAAASDADLCLLAYATWGEDCLERLHGDFAFALWDKTRRTLFCARDRLGVRTLTYLEQGGSWWMSDSLSDLLAASGYVGQALDRVWIRDFLKDGFCDDPSRTVYADVHRLLPGHSLAITADFALTRPYWLLKLAQPIFLKSAGDYAERFHALLSEAILDRMPSGDVGILMSGGLDSSTLVAKTIELIDSPERVKTRTWLVGAESDPEHRASRLVAKYLGVAQEIIASDLLHYDPTWREHAVLRAEPSWGYVHPPARLADMQVMQQQAEVWLYGEGPDNTLTFEWRAYLKWLAQRGMWWRLARSVVTYLGAKSLKEWGTTLGVWSGRKRVNWPTPDLSWIRDLGHSLAPSANGDDTKSWRPVALRSVRGPKWPALLESLDNEYAATGIDWRHPYLDLRLLEFMLSTPPIPWGRRKRLIRSAMKSRLPQEILERAKTPLHLDLLGDQLRLNPPIMPLPGSKIAEFVDIEQLPSDPANFIDPYALLRVSILDHWLNMRND